MSKSASIQNEISKLYVLESLAEGNSVIHKLHPFVKLFTSFALIVIIASFSRYSLAQLIPFVFYPAILMALAEIPYSLLFKRTLIALPFCLFAGISNVIFDTDTALFIAGIPISYGTISLFTIILKVLLCVTIVLILVSVTPLRDLTDELRRLRMPGIIVITFEMTYRYIGVLADEAHRMYTSYLLRSKMRKGLKIGDMGSFVGQLFLRSIDRSERIYNAMKCRGYSMDKIAYAKRPLKINDYIYLFVIIVFAVSLRVFDVGAAFSELIGAIIR